MALRSVGIRLQAEVSGYVNNLRTASRATQGFVGDLDKAAKAGRLDAVADSAARMGLVLAGGFALAVGAAAKFDKAMSSVSAATRASSGEMEQLRQAALQAGKDTAFSATQAAAGIEELAKAGVSTADILGGGLAGALDLAAAGQIDVGEAAESAASAMVQFKLSGSDVSHVADLLAAGAGKAQGSVRDLSMALSQGGLVAAQMGMSVEDTTGTLAAFASAGLLGSDAGTSLKTALLMLAKPTGEAAKLMTDLGISAYDSSGQFVGITSLAGQLQTKLGGLTQEQRNAALATIFGADAIRSASILYAEGADGIQGWIDKVNDAGFAEDTARKKTDNLAGDIERLTGELETLAITSGGGANSGLRLLVKSAEALVSQIGSLNPLVASGGVVLAGLTGVLLLGFAAWIKTRRGIALAVAELNAVGPAGARAATALQATAKWAGRAGIAFLALQVAGAVLSATQEDLNIQTEALGKGLAEWGRTGRLAGESARVLGENMDDLNTGFKFLADTDNSRRKFARWGQDLLEFVVPGLDGTNTSLAKTRERVAAIDQELAQLVQGGNADAAAATFERFAASQAAQGVSLDEVKAQFPGYAAALEVAGRASGDAAGKIGEVGGAADTAATQVEKLKTAFDDLFGARMGYDKALIAYRQGIKDLNKELTEGKRTLDTNTQAGRDNATGVLEQIEHIEELRDARIDHGETLDEANGKYIRDIAGLRATLLQLGYTETAVDSLVGGYEEIPEEIETPVSAPGAKAATRQVENFNFAIDQTPEAKTAIFRADTKPARGQVNAYREWLKSLPLDKVSTVTVRRITEQYTTRGGAREFNRWGGIYEHAQAGLINLRQAGMYSPQGPARYAFAEPATGGEAFVPKRGDRRRSLGILDAAAGWYGATVRPQTAPQIAGGTAVNHYNINVQAWTDRFTLRQVQQELAMHGAV